MYKRNYFTILAMGLTLCSPSSQAETRIGVGLGPLYNGIGVNFSRSNGTTLSFGSIGCVGYSSSSQVNQSDSGLSDSTKNSDSSCGFGAGYFSTTPFPNNKHALGLGFGLNYNTGINGSSGIEWALTPSYVFFLNGIDKRGINLGIGAFLNRQDSGFENPGVLINVGFHF